jgi:hypothetical protein
MTLEAIALHHIETLNAQIGRFRDLLNSRRDPSQPWTEYNRLLGRPLFAGYPDGGHISAPHRPLTFRRPNSWIIGLAG